CGLMELGPDETDEPAEPLLAVLEGLTSALRHVWRRPTVGLAFLVVMAVRFCFGLCTLIVLLLFQRYFTQGVGFLRTGPTGIAEVLAVGAIGVLAGAVVTAPMVRRLGRTRYLVVLLTLTAVLVVVFGVQFAIWSTLVTTFTVGFAYQSSKVCMDTVVQADSDDAFVGRVFALYDTVNTLCYVGAFIVGVLLVPANGAGIGAVLLVAGIFLVTGLGYGIAVSRMRRGPATKAEMHMLATSAHPTTAHPTTAPVEVGVPGEMGQPAAANGGPAATVDSTAGPTAHQDAHHQR
ncbi:MAG TPA: MFS transporter, partial [Nakamurella sp.]